MARLVGDGLQLLDKPGRLVGSCGRESATAQGLGKSESKRQRQR